MAAPELLGNLLRVEIEARRARGEEPARWDYYPRFPGDRQLIERIFQRDARNETPVTDTTSAHVPTPSTSVASSQNVPELHERYRLEERIGGGGFGEVSRGK